MKLKFRIEEKGGAGSGHHGHAGRPGKHGGSLPGSGGGSGSSKPDTGNEQWQGYAPEIPGDVNAPVTTHRKVASALAKEKGVFTHLPKGRGKFEARAKFKPDRKGAVARVLREKGFHDLTPEGGFPESAGRQGLFGKNNYFYHDSLGRVYFNPKSNLAAFMATQGNTVTLSIIDNKASRIIQQISQSD